LFKKAKSDLFGGFHAKLASFQHLFGKLLSNLHADSFGLCSTLQRKNNE
jgi:hypothetical protein